MPCNTTLNTTPLIALKGLRHITGTIWQFYSTHKYDSAKQEDRTIDYKAIYVLMKHLS